jgi:hypothetical protein
MSKALVITLTRISPTHHQFACTRPDGTGESFALESKSFLFHDLLHFSIESEAQLKQSFYGLLASGQPYAVLSKAMDEQTNYGEIAVTERIVGGMTGVMKQNIPADQFIAVMKNLFEAYTEPLPTWLTPDFIERVKERMRKLQGEWNALPFGHAMTLTWNRED